ncbi:ROK family protein [Paraclostridium bifermentans]|uniref:ROK family protein n=1 Tax=Paraclostridium bifermentans TaxID=1490 RepID=A0ABY8R3A5_PARBF|nr:ROK family protein [Paraclostridium bifermentans]
MKKFICIDIGGTSIKYGILRETGIIIEKGNMDTNALKEGGQGIFEKIKYIISNYLKDYEVEGICISTAGMVDPKDGKILFALERLNTWIYRDGNQKEVEKEFNIRCEVENDVNCAGLGEMWLGAGKGASSAVCLTIGTGIGGCIIINNELTHGFSNSAGEIGYMKINGEDFQNIASTTSLVKRVARLKNIAEENIDGKMIFDMAKNKDQDCLKEIDYMIKSLAIGIANLSYIINPEVIILGGGIMAQEQFLKPKIEVALRKELIKTVYENTRIEFAKRQNDAGMIGALYNFSNKK